MVATVSGSGALAGRFTRAGVDTGGPSGPGMPAETAGVGATCTPTRTTGAGAGAVGSTPDIGRVPGAYGITAGTPETDDGLGLAGRARGVP